MVEEQCQEPGQCSVGIERKSLVFSYIIRKFKRLCR